ncbi:MAG: hypothetical protein J7513_05200 [Solirubrobacteraceae bacterium]|nr:hypothetical protein [Solirubrobacteraceae bacterium]
MSSSSARPGLQPHRLAAAIRGGDAWVMPVETVDAVWVSATAPAIRVLDLRARPAAASATQF